MRTGICCPQVCRLLHMSREAVAKLQDLPSAFARDACCSQGMDLPAHLHQVTTVGRHTGWPWEGCRLASRRRTMKPPTMHNDASMPCFQDL